MNNFHEVGIRAKLQPIERGGFAAAFGAKKYTRGILLVGSGAFGNAATRLASFVVTGGPNVYGSYLDIDALYRSRPSNSTREAGRDPRKDAAAGAREGDLRADLVIGVPQRCGPRVGECRSAASRLPLYRAFEDITIK